ncbi:MAG: DUF1761 domain-containing protein [Candidatus Dojkabacteria bacterium]|nr:MAG: DUF1761 domain-containing protein [Candidatus Dojkabacteria bacterium]
MFNVLGVEVSLLAITLAVVANMVLGMLWYGPILGKQWVSLVGKKKEDLVMKPTDILVAIVMATLIAIGMNSILHFARDVSGLDYLQNVLVSAGMVATVFIIPVLGNEIVWEGRNPKLIALNWGHQFATYLVSGLVLGWFIYN